MPSFMLVVQELAVKVGERGDLDESARNTLDDIKASKNLDLPNDMAAWKAKVHLSLKLGRTFVFDTSRSI